MLAPPLRSSSTALTPFLGQPIDSPADDRLYRIAAKGSTQIPAMETMPATKPVAGIAPNTNDNDNTNANSNTRHCGDGVVSPGEDCDGQNLGGQDCISISQGFDEGQGRIFVINTIL